MIDIGWIFTYLTKNRELDPCTAESILQVILRAMRDNAERCGNER